MCESNVYVEKDGVRTEFMKDVAKLEVTPSGIVCYDIVGEKREVAGGRFKVANLMDHSIVLVVD
jgi:predicted RNA-binding protein